MYIIVLWFQQIDHQVLPHNTSGLTAEIPSMETQIKDVPSEQTVKTLTADREVVGSQSFQWALVQPGMTTILQAAGGQPWPQGVQMNDNMQKRSFQAGGTDVDQDFTGGTMPQLTAHQVLQPVQLTAQVHYTFYTWWFGR